MKPAPAWPAEVYHREQFPHSLGQSPRATARRFSSDLRMSWSEALRRIRIIRAVEALATSENPVTEIAYSVGYNSISAFNAAFRDLMGKNPTEYGATFKRQP